MPHGHNEYMALIDTPDALQVRLAAAIADGWEVVPPLMLAGFETRHGAVLADRPRFAVLLERHTHH